MSACPVCGGGPCVVHAHVPDVAGLRPEGFELSRCSECGADHVQPVLSEAELAAWYPDAFYGESSTASGLASRLFLALRAQAVWAHKRSGRLLDVGCGAGDFLGTMAGKGFSVAGMEPSEAGRARAQAHTPDVAASLHDLGDAVFDVITLWQALEHTPTPARTLRWCRDHVAQDGVVVVSVPNRGSLEARVGGARWFHLDVPRHQVHFTRPSLERLLHRCGFEVVARSTWSPEYNPFGLVQTALNALPVEHNALYQLVKHGRPLRDFNKRTQAALLGTLAVLPTATVAALGLDAALAPSLGGATLRVVARPR